MAGLRSSRPADVIAARRCWPLTGAAPDGNDPVARRVGTALGGGVNPAPTRVHHDPAAAIVTARGWAVQSGRTIPRATAAGPANGCMTGARAASRTTPARARAHVSRRVHACPGAAHAWAMVLCGGWLRAAHCDGASFLLDRRRGGQARPTATPSPADPCPNDARRTGHGSIRVHACSILARRMGSGRLIVGRSSSGRVNRTPAGPRKWARWKSVYRNVEIVGQKRRWRILARWRDFVDALRRPPPALGDWRTLHHNGCTTGSGRSGDGYRAPGITPPAGTTGRASATRRTAPSRVMYVVAQVYVLIRSLMVALGAYGVEGVAAGIPWATYHRCLQGWHRGYQAGIEPGMTYRVRYHRRHRGDGSSGPSSRKRTTARRSIFIPAAGTITPTPGECFGRSTKRS